MRLLCGACRACREFAGVCRYFRLFSLRSFAHEFLRFLIRANDCGFARVILRFSVTSERFPARVSSVYLPIIKTLLNRRSYNDTRPESRTNFWSAFHNRRIAIYSAACFLPQSFPKRVNGAGITKRCFAKKSIYFYPAADRAVFGAERAMRVDSEADLW